MVFVTIIEGKNIMLRETSSSPDFHCVIGVASCFEEKDGFLRFEKYPMPVKSHVCKKTSNPKWNPSSDLTFLAGGVFNGILIEIWNNDKLLGQFKLEQRDFMIQSSGDRWFKLEGRIPKIITGEILVRYDCRDLIALMPIAPPKPVSHPSQPIFTKKLFFNAALCTKIDQSPRGDHSDGVPSPRHPPIVSGRLNPAGDLTPRSKKKRDCDGYAERLHQMQIEALRQPKIRLNSFSNTLQNLPLPRRASRMCPDRRSVSLTTLNLAQRKAEDCENLPPLNDDVQQQQENNHSELHEKFSRITYASPRIQIQSPSPSPTALAVSSADSDDKEELKQDVVGEIDIRARMARLRESFKKIKAIGIEPSDMSGKIRGEANQLVSNT
eukprot:TRINITY_DN4209_c0_g1_i1.p1 TRINITY_DN4209_c0_g1~~TRINITY_DN4209_c0_g1_i1.p1  ORF type:complete len:381 (+),score=67.42 TRINITY_DN4209_c0_g1_i1:98-1240(+)